MLDEHLAQWLCIELKFEVHLLLVHLVVSSFNRNPAALHCLIAILSDMLICYAFALAFEVLRVSRGVVRNMCTKRVFQEHTAAFSQGVVKRAWFMGFAPQVRHRLEVKLYTEGGMHRYFVVVDDLKF